MTRLVVWDKIKSWLPGNSEARQKRILLGVKKKIVKQDEKNGRFVLT